LVNAEQHIQTTGRYASFLGPDWCTQPIVLLMNGGAADNAGDNLANQDAVTECKDPTSCLFCYR